MTKPKCRSILLEPKEVSALLHGWKKEMRIPVDYDYLDHCSTPFIKKCSFRKGSFLYVKELWGIENPEYVKYYNKNKYMGSPDPSTAGLRYRLEEEKEGTLDVFRDDFWRPAEKMPMWASRIFLEVTGVYPQRIQDINESEATAEGFHPITRDCKRPKFQERWEARHPGSWNENVPVWKITFRRLTDEEWWSKFSW